MGELRPWHIIVLAVVVVLLFGSKRLPDVARGLGRSLRILKAETRGLADDSTASHLDATDETAGPPYASGPAPAAAAAPTAPTAPTAPGAIGDSTPTRTPFADPTASPAPASAPDALRVPLPPQS